MLFAVPFCDLRSTLVRFGPIALGLVMALPGCGGVDTGRMDCDYDCASVDGGGTFSDASVGVGIDAAAPADAGASPPASNEADFGGSACWNGRDDNDDGIEDCQDPACGGVPYCCLGQAREQCCAAALELTVDFTQCEGTDPATCGAQLTSFGQPSAIVENGALVPNGGESSDAGLVLGDGMDALRERVTVSASIAASLGGCTDCVDALGIAIGDAVSGDLVTMHPDAAVLVRPARLDVAFIVAGEVIGAQPLTDESAHAYAVTVAPDGVVVFTVDEVETARATWAPRPDRHAVIYGRTQNRPADAPPPPRALDFTVSTKACEIPSALARESGAILPGIDARAPSAASNDTDVRIAFESGGDIHLARPDGSGGWTLSGDLAVPALAAPDGEAYRDPELVRGDGRWLLYVTREHDGTTSIARAEGDASFGETFSAPITLDAPAPLSAPSVATWSGATLVAAVTEVGSVPRIVLLDADLDSLSWHGGSAEAAVVVERRGGIRAFDADEVGGPALFVDGAGLLRLYYAGRRGTRWSAGMIASGDGVTFTAPSETPVLAPSDAGFDARAVSGPSVVRVGDGRDLFYGGSDGASHTIGRAVGATRG